MKTDGDANLKETTKTGTSQIVYKEAFDAKRR